MIKDKIVYLAGPITNHPTYKIDFQLVEAKARSLGARVILNPAVLPAGLTHEAYMRICFVMLAEANFMLLLPGWRDSKGATMEFFRAMDHELPIYEVDFISNSMPPTLTRLSGGAL